MLEETETETDLKRKRNEKATKTMHELFASMVDGWIIKKTRKNWHMSAININ